MANTPPPASATAPSPRRGRRAGRGSQSQPLLLKGDGDSAVPNLVCADGPLGCSTGTNGGCSEHHSPPRCWHSPAPAKGDDSSSARGTAPTPAALPEHATEHQPDARPLHRARFLGVRPQKGGLRKPPARRGSGTAGRAETRRAGSPAPSCPWLRQLVSHPSTQHPGTKSCSAALPREDKGLKCRPPTPSLAGQADEQ